jgi:hypothetical protein
MRLNIPPILCAAAFLAALPALAGKESGGGNVEICFDPADVALARRLREDPHLYNEYLPKIRSIRALDRVEAEARYGKDGIARMERGETADAYFERMASRFDSTVPAISETLRAADRELQTHLAEDPAGVEPTRDVHLVAMLEDHCAPATFAVQVDFGDYAELHVDQRLLRGLRGLPPGVFSDWDKAVILRLHEPAYLRHRRNFNDDARKAMEATGARSARNLTGLLLANRLGMSLWDTWSQFGALYFRFLDKFAFYRGLPYVNTYYGSNFTALQGASRLQATLFDGLLKAAVSQCPAPAAELRPLMSGWTFRDDCQLLEQAISLIGQYNGGSYTAPMVQVLAKHGYPPGQQRAEYERRRLQSIRDAAGSLYVKIQDEIPGTAPYLSPAGISRLMGQWLEKVTAIQATGQFKTPLFTEDELRWLLEVPMEDRP